jgi:hypothetical protein
MVLTVTISTIHQLRPVSQEPFLATGMLVPTPGAGGPRLDRGASCFAH